MKVPVVVNGRNYEYEAIRKLVQQTGRDIRGEYVSLNDSRQFYPSSNYIFELCDNARDNARIISDEKGLKYSVYSNDQISSVKSSSRFALSDEQP